MEDTRKIDGQISPDDDDVLIGDVLQQVREAELRAGPLPERIGRYRVIKTLGEGGMGVVYLAEQENTHRQVALKVVRPGVASSRTLSRLKHEAEVLAQLQHPGIAQVFEAGTNDTGHGEQPYFAMELIKGQTLSAHAEQHRLDTRQRLELLARVCDAVQHAHQKGVIHRDLKPGNILVDHTGQPKILDFGVARATAEDAQLTVLQTDIGQLVGTLPYMSPEQVEGHPGDLDTRSDVYSLGVVAYQLLTGRLPYNLKDRTVPEMTRIIAEQDPTPIDSTDRALRGDIRTIIDKALEKDRSRRYPSAAMLAADIRHYLNDEPISARPAGTLYQLRKLMLRHKVASAFMAAVAVLVITFSVWISVLFARAEAARAAELDQRLRAQRGEAAALVAQAAAAQEAEQARRDRDNANAVKEFFIEMLAWTDPFNRPAQASTFQGMFDDAAGRLASCAEMNSEVKADIHDTLGLAYARLGRCALAEGHLRQALEIRQEAFGRQHLDVAESLEHLSFNLFYRWLSNPHQEPHEYDEAIALCRQAHAIRCKLQGERHEQTLITLGILGTLHHLAGDLETADEIMIAANLAGLENYWGTETVDGLMQQALAFIRTSVPPHAPVVPDEVRPERSADRSDSESRLALARALTRAGLGIIRQQWREGQHELARSLIRLCYQRFINDPQWGASIPWTLTIFAERRVRLGDYDAAEPILYEALEAAKARFGDQAQVYLAWNLENLAAVSHARGDLAGAEDRLRQALNVRYEMLGDQHPTVAVTLEKLATLLVQRDRFDLAEPLLADCRDIRRRSLGQAHWLTAYTESLLGECLTRLGQYETAERLLVDSYAVIRKRFGGEHPRTLAALGRIIEFYELCGEAGQAATYRALLPEPPPLEQRPPP